MTANATTICTRTQSLTLGLLKLTMQWVNAIGEQFSHGTAESMGNGDTFLTPVRILFHPGAMWTIQTLVATQNLAQKELHITGHAWLVDTEVQ